MCKPAQRLWYMTVTFRVQVSSVADSIHLAGKASYFEN